MIKPKLHFTPRGRHARPVYWARATESFLRVCLAAVTIGVVLAYLSPNPQPYSLTPWHTGLAATAPMAAHVNQVTPSNAPVGSLGSNKRPDLASALPKKAHPEASSTSRYTPKGALSLIHKYFPKDQWSIAAKVAFCESSLRYLAHNTNTNGTIDRGLFQLNSGGTEQSLLKATGHSPADLTLAYNPVWNVYAASLLYHQSGWYRWTCYDKVTKS